MQPIADSDGRPYDTDRYADWDDPSRKSEAPTFVARTSGRLAAWVGADAFLGVPLGHLAHDAS